MIYFKSARRKSGIPIIIGAIDKLVKDEILYDKDGIATGKIIQNTVDILDDEGNPVLDDEGNVKTRSKLQSWSTDITSDILGENLAIVYVQADEDILTELALTFDDAGHPYKTNDDGTDHEDKIKYDGLVREHQSTEKQDRFKVKNEIDAVGKVIADYVKQNIQAAALLIVYGADIEDLQLIGNALEAYENTGENEQALFDGLTELFPNQSKSWIIILTTGRINPNIFEVIQQFIDSEISGIQRRSDRLSAQITQRIESVSGEVVGGQNLTQRKVELETKLATFPNG